MQPKLYARDEIYRMLTSALVKKKPLPPDNWSVVKLDNEVRFAGKEFEPNLFLRHRDALATAIFYLVDFACQMPERVILSTENERIRQMCGELADEIEQITYEPDAVIAKHGKLKVWLKAILAVQTCWIYTEETKRFIAEEDEVKRQRRITSTFKKSPPKAKSQSDKWQSPLAKQILNKISGKQNVSEQPSLF